MAGDSDETTRNDGEWLCRIPAATTLWPPQSRSRRIAFLFVSGSGATDADGASPFESSKAAQKKPPPAVFDRPKLALFATSSNYTGRPPMQQKPRLSGAFVH